MFIFLLVFSGSLKAQSYFPIPVTGFNQDVIAEDWIPFNHTTSSLDYNDFGGNNVIPTRSLVINHSGYPLSLAGLPDDGIINSEAPATPFLTFEVNNYSQNNSLRLLMGGGDIKTLTLVTPTKAESIFILATTGNGDSDTDITIHFQGGSSQSENFVNIPDWLSNGNATYPIAKSGMGRVQRETEEFEGISPPDFNLFQYEIPIDPAYQNLNITKIDFENWQGVLNVFAISGWTDCDVDPITVVSNKDGLCPGDTAILTASGSLGDEIWYQGTDPFGESKTQGSPYTVSTPGTYYFKAYNLVEDCWGPPVGIEIENLGFDDDLEVEEDVYLTCDDPDGIEIGFSLGVEAPDGYCTPIGKNLYRYIDSFTTTGGDININN